MATQTPMRLKIGEMLPPTIKQPLSRALFRAYAAMAKTRAPYEYLFVLTHERAGSSLLALLLGNHHEICGYGETGLAYQSRSDLQMLVGSNLFRLRPFNRPGNERYMMDKIVYEDLLAEEDFPLLLREKAKIVFLIREPVGAIRSMMPSMGLDETFAAVFYIRRLDYLESYARIMAGTDGAFLLSYEDLISRSDSTLAALSSYLNLQSPLSQQYEVLRPMKGRGAAHHSKLHTGYIDDALPEAAEAQISDRNLQVAREAYERCWMVLSAVSVTAADDE